MPTRLSTILGLTREELEDNGVYDSTVDFDSHLHIDPALLLNCRIPEFQNANKKVTSYFNDILTLLTHSDGKDALWRRAVNNITFGEGLNTGLGYSEKGIAGSGIGPEIAARMVQTAKEIINAGVIDPAIFDLVPLFEPGIGPDRISDMISIILKDEFHAYTERLSSELGVKERFDEIGLSIVFVPKEILSDLPIAEQWEDIEVAAAYNEGIREALSSLIGKSWKEIAKEYTKQGLKALLINNPDLLRELLARYKARQGNGYNFVLDHLGILLWDALGKQVADEHFLDLKRYKDVNADNIFDIVTQICTQFKRLIEHNGLVEHLYDADEKKRPERFAQLLFFAIADSYCNANGLDLSREINGGSGALDFKVSMGKAKVNVELKYSSNPKLVEGYEKQLPAYNKAEAVKNKHSIYLVLRVNKSGDHKINKIAGIHDEYLRNEEESPTLLVIQAIKLPPASKR